MEINIEGIDKLELLHALWNRQIAPNNGFYKPPFSKDAAIIVIKNGEIDYFCGKAIKMDLSSDVVEPRLYDRDAGKGAFMEVLNKLKKE
jgi:hypothetical protein